MPVEKMERRVGGQRKTSWQGNKAGYHAIHIWVTSRLGRPKICWHCNTKKAKRFEWANISKKYLREGKNWENDWIRLCVSCHRKFDNSFILNRGEAHLNSKLTNKNIIEIRKLYKPIEYGHGRLAKEFHVHKSTIKDIIKKRTWVHI